MDQAAEKTSTPRIITGYIGPMHYHKMHWHRHIKGHDWRVQRLPHDKLLQFAIDLLNGKIFTSHQVEPFDDMALVFPALSFICEISNDARKEIGAFYEYADQAVPEGKTRHGQPVFTTVRFMHVEDWEIARSLVATLATHKEGM